MANKPYDPRFLAKFVEFAKRHYPNEVLDNMIDLWNFNNLRRERPLVFNDIIRRVTQSNNEYRMIKFSKTNAAERMKAAMETIPKEVPKARLDEKKVQQMVQPDLFG